MVETIGGVGAALDYTTRALKAGKSVVTANKELVAAHGYELLQLAKEHGVSYLFEASVGGGIPILRPLNACLAANEVDQVTGILNGTTNYILTRMIKAGLTFDQALKEARPTAMPSRTPPPTWTATTPAARPVSWRPCPSDSIFIPTRCPPRDSGREPGRRGLCRLLRL